MFIEEPKMIVEIGTILVVETCARNWVERCLFFGSVIGQVFLIQSSHWLKSRNNDHPLIDRPLRGNLKDLVVLVIKALYETVKKSNLDIKEDLLVDIVTNIFPKLVQITNSNSLKIESGLQEYLFCSNCWIVPMTFIP